MILLKAAYFLTDVELQFQWYAEQAGWDIAEGYLSAVEATCALLRRQPLLGPAAALTHPKLARWRFINVVRPYHRHLLFYELIGDELIVRRALHGHRHLPQRLLEPPGAE